ncbi:hypothetical protein BDZ94DRAFT_1248738 [Collybia nuda]|uniref:Oxidoreductase AflY n=1 Tax=Collybia nuda TaxID=64659 RepID=A0A9P5YCW9_9AGAR|nr:hypothetical protein BDZ94DRAFT_1248738 [Collybia nuda]
MRLVLHQTYRSFLPSIKTGGIIRPLHNIHCLSTMTTPTEFSFFPPPSAPESKYIPSWIGSSPDSTATLIRILEDNHRKWHIFYNDKGFHNHAAHRVIALWSLGAESDVIKGGYDEDSRYQRSAIDSPQPITAANFNDRLGDELYYRSYLVFFKDSIKDKGTTATVEEYVFSQRANFEVLDSKKPHPVMFDRFLGGLLHPMIHTGYGLEFGLPGMTAEGLAEAAVHPLDDVTAFGPESFIETDAVSPLRPAALATSPSVHAFTVLARILNDPEIGGVASKEGIKTYSDTMRRYGSALKKHLREWHVDTSNPQALSRRMEELVWTSVLIYGVGGWKLGKEFNADFCYMHLVTSSIFLGSFMHHLTPMSQGVLLRGYFLASLAWWVSRGCADLDIKRFSKHTTTHPARSGPLPTPENSTLPFPSSPKAVTPNPWLPIIETSLVHPDEHLSKLQRALFHYSSLFGARPAGLLDFQNTELSGAEVIDGSLFIRVAGLTAKRMGRVREGEKMGDWDRSGFRRP